MRRRCQNETTQQTTRSGFHACSPESGVRRRCQRETTQQTTRSGFHACSPESGVRRRCQRETTQQTTRSGFHACSPESGVRRRRATRNYTANYTIRISRVQSGERSAETLPKRNYTANYTIIGFHACSPESGVRRRRCQSETTQQTTRSSGFHACSPESGVRRRCATCVYHRVFHNTFRTHTYRHLATPLFLKRRPVFSTLSQGKRQKLASDRKSQTVALWVRKVFGVSSRSREDLTKHLPPACRCS